MPKQLRIFISHHHTVCEDASTELLKRDLQSAGADVWVDYQDATAGSFVERIGEGMKERQWLVLVTTPAALASPWVQLEVNTALLEVTKRRMLGVLLLEIEPCPEDDIPVLWQAFPRYDATRGYEQARTGLFNAMGLHESLRADILELEHTSSFTEEGPHRWRASNGLILQGHVLEAYRTMTAWGHFHGLTALGLPLENEQQLADNVITQRFERGLLVYDPKRTFDNPLGAEGDFYLGHVRRPEDLKWLPRMGSKIALRAWNGQYITADQANGCLLVATASEIHEWELFELVEPEQDVSTALPEIETDHLGKPITFGDRVAFKSLSSNYYVTTDLNDGALLRASATWPRGWETFELVRPPSSCRAPDDPIGFNTCLALRATNGQFVNCNLPVNQELRASVPDIREWETFAFVLQG